MSLKQLETAAPSELEGGGSKRAIRGVATRLAVPSGVQKKDDVQSTEYTVQYIGMDSVRRERRVWRRWNALLAVLHATRRFIKHTGARARWLYADQIWRARPYKKKSPLWKPTATRY